MQVIRGAVKIALRTYMMLKFSEFPVACILIVASICHVTSYVLVPR